MSNLKSKFIPQNSIDGSKFILNNNQPLRSFDTTGKSIDLLKFESNNLLIPLDINLSGKNIESVNLVDGVKVSSHASRHLPDGSDPLTTASGSLISTSSSNLAGIANSLSRSDHSHKVEVTFFKDQSTTSVSTSSSTPSIISGMQRTPPAGTYLVIFSGNVRTKGNGNSSGVTSIFVGGTQLSPSKRDLNLQVSMALGLIGTTVMKPSGPFLIDVVTVNGSQQIDIRYNSTQGTTYCDERTLLLLRLS